MAGVRRISGRIVKRPTKYDSYEELSSGPKRMKVIKKPLLKMNSQQVCTSLLDATPKNSSRIVSSVVDTCEMNSKQTFTALVETTVLNSLQKSTCLVETAAPMNCIQACTSVVDTGQENSEQPCTSEVDTPVMNSEQTSTSLVDTAALMMNFEQACTSVVDTAQENSEQPCTSEVDTPVMNSEQTSTSLVDTAALMMNFEQACTSVVDSGPENSEQTCTSEIDTPVMNSEQTSICFVDTAAVMNCELACTSVVDPGQENSEQPCTSEMDTPVMNSEQTSTSLVDTAALMMNFEQACTSVVDTGQENSEQPCTSEMDTPVMNSEQTSTSLVDTAALMMNFEQACTSVVDSGQENSEQPCTSEMDTPVMNSEQTSTSLVNTAAPISGQQACTSVVDIAAMDSEQTCTFLVDTVTAMNSYCEQACTSVIDTALVNSEQTCTSEATDNSNLSSAELGDFESLIFESIDENGNVCEEKCNVTVCRQDDGTLVYEFALPVNSQPPYGEYSGLIAYDAVILGGKDEGEVDNGSVAELSSTAQINIDENSTSSTEFLDPACSVNKRTRRRQRYHKTCKQNHRIIKRNSGKKYLNSNGVVVEAKSFKAEHSCGLKGTACNEIKPEDPQDQFRSFWDLGNFDLQNAHLVGLVDERRVANHVVKNCLFESETRDVSVKKRTKEKSRVFYLPNPNGRTRVCKVLFLSTFGISNGRLHRALKKQRDNKGIQKPDQRGKHKKHSLPSIVQQSVVDHISKFPRYVSHYTRSHEANKEYLATNLNLTTMYRLYCEDCLSNSITPASDSFYRNVFATKFNLSFHQPLKDTCSKCDRFNILLAAQPNDTSLNVEKELHLRKADKVRAKLNACKQSASDENLCITFDLQKTLITPEISTGVAYYKRQLATYNCGIHNLCDNTATMFMWHEGSAGRGASEIGTCIYNYVRAAEMAKSVVGFCDSCGGQNRNFKIATLMNHCVSELPIDSFTINFMQSGHSFLPNDADFGVIEKKKKTGKDIYIPQHWMTLVREARKKNPFKVVEMKSDEFLDLGGMSKQLVNRKEAVDGTNIEWLKIQTICFKKNRPGIMQYKYVCDEEASWSEVDMRRGHANKRESKSTQIVMAVTSRKIKLEKWRDLQSLKQFIPPIYHAFYDGLPTEKTDKPDNELDLIEDEMLNVSEDEL